MSKRQEEAREKWEKINQYIKGKKGRRLVSVVIQSLSHAQLCDSMHYSTSGFLVPHYLPEFPQVHVHWVGDAIQPSHPLPPASPFAFSLAQHQSLFQWASFLTFRKNLKIVLPFTIALILQIGKLTLNRLNSMPKAIELVGVMVRICKKGCLSKKCVLCP